MKYLILIFLSFIYLISSAQPDFDNVCILKDNRLVFHLDIKWTIEDKQMVSETFDIDSIVLVKAFLEIPIIIHDSVEWKVKRINKKTIELSKIQTISSIEEIDIHSHIHEGIIKKILKLIINKDHSVSFGTNKFKLESVFSYKDSIAHFFLPGYTNASKVHISDNFNKWSTMQTPMQNVDSGWFVELKLLPGKYSYKYIVNGKWTPDPNNLTEEENEHGTINSVFYCYNHIFKLKAFKDAENVIVAGSFNNWEEEESEMKSTDTGWELPVYLDQGTHTYKFIVDGNWITDPDNPLVRNDGKGNKNSILELGDKFEFFLKGYEDAEQIILTGNFNDWNENELKMKKTNEGWVFSYVLGPGVYEYKYIADGKWMIDSTNQYSIGSGEFTNSLLFVKPNYTFVLKDYQNAEEVYVTGSFNGWNEPGYLMERKNGEWIFPVYLNVGKHLYKFIVDNEWIIDPNNSLYEQNEHGTYNSVLWIK